MNRLKAKLDANVAAMSERERYFAPSFAAARNLLDGAIVGNHGLHFPSGAVCGPHGCSCGDKACLHQVGWRIFSYDPA